MVNIVFPGQTNHHATLYGGDALKLMDQAAFVAATRDARAIMVTAAIDHVDFTSPIHEGELVEMISRVRMRGRTSMRVEVELWAEHLLSGVRRHAATAMFTMVSVDAARRPHPIRITAAS